MNKQKRTFVILAIVLVACMAGYLGLLNYNKYKSDDDVYLSSNTILGTIPDSIEDMVETEDSESTETE
ncbi:hypothetical protein KQH92_10590, partial [[Eubacterium] rectale]|nr:hypothetical protein [Agathobacter rectalis]